MGFAAPDIERTSYSDVTEQRSNRASAPELEVEELEADALFEAGIPLEVQRSSDVGPRISSLKPTFNDRLSSVDIEPLSVDAVLPDFSGLPRDSQRPVSMPPAPESVRRALALIDDEEINAEDEDQRVTQDFGFLSGEGVNPRTAGASHGRTGLSQRPPSLPPAKPSQTPAPASARSIPPPADAPTSQRPSRLQAELEGQREAWLPPSIPGPSPRSIPPVSSRPAATDPPPSFKTASGLGPESNPTPFRSGSMPPGSMPPGSMPPGSMPPGSMPPGSVVPGAPSSVPGVPPSINLMQTPMVPAPSSRPGWAPPAEPFMRTPSSRPPEVARLSRRAPPAPGDLLSMDLGELTLEVSDLGPPAQRAASSPPGPLSQSSDSWRALKAAAAPEPEEFPTPTTEVDGLSLTELRGFEDLPPDVQQSLAASATIQPLDADEEVGFFGAAVVTAGSVDILPAISDDSGAVAGPGDVVFTKGTLPDSIALRVVAKLDGTRVAIWEPAVFEAAIAPCPWLHDELRFIADYFIAVCGAALGPLGERLDPALRTAVFKRLEVKALQADEVLLQEGAPIASLFVVGGGRLLVSKGGVDSDELLPGGFVFADKMMMARPAPATVRAGAQGALLLYAPRAVAHELMMSVPPLLEVLAG
jgi:hypothetical protein